MASASIGDPQSLNLFAYVTNNPVDFVDPSGTNISSSIGGCPAEFDYATCRALNAISGNPHGRFGVDRGGFPSGTLTIGVLFRGNGDGGYDPIYAYAYFTPDLSSRRSLDYSQTDPRTTLPTSEYVGKVLDRKNREKKLSCREFLNRVVSELGSQLDIDQLYNDIKERIFLRTSLPRNYIGWATIKNGKRRIDVKINMRATDNFGFAYYYTRIIFHELIHHARKKGGGGVNSHKEMEEAFEVATGETRKKDNEKRNQYLDRLINDHCAIQN